ncbi:unnamed protein product, partial [Mesorhabditis belari]|uniref:Prefoldin subunit 1 n=1 Tax=Mesorhabditis belari TaxID=2138241 RepID=A0AAF3FFA4_9BILA
MAADAELKKAFQDLQMKMADAKQKIGEGEAQKKKYSAKSRIADLTADQLKNFPASTSVYQTLGRMFVLSGLDQEISRHSDESKGYKEKVAALDRQKEYLQKSVEESEKNLREMIEIRRRE